MQEERAQEERVQVGYERRGSDENSFEELNIAVRAPNDANRSIAVRALNDANGCTARSSRVAEDGRMALAPLVKLRKRRINRVPSGTMRRRKWVRGTVGVRTQSND